MASSSSSSSIVPHAKYDVFLSFRGEDTRDNFASHLYYALHRKQIVTFIDDDGLGRGEEIFCSLLKAIEESKISVIIFSKDYASSKWCLDELAKILECKKMNGQMVIPIFYNIKPSDVRKQMGSFQAAFLQHEKHFKKTSEKVKKWRDDLTEAANLSGWDSFVTKPEAKLVEEIVRDILKKLKNTSSSNDYEGLVGLESRIKQVRTLLHIGAFDFRIIGIWGMGGIGKTTIAGVIFNQISSLFEGYCFIANVRKESTEQGGLVRLREQVISQILDGENIKIGTPDIPQNIQKRLKYKNVFIVLDDVTDLGQLEFLTGGLDQFGPGSRIVITTRDKQVLHSYGVKTIYEVKEFNENEAFQLFYHYAFKKNCPFEDHIVLSRRVIVYAKGNPLALKVLGSSLYRKSKQVWENALNKLKRISNPEIFNVLKISFDGLDYEEKEIFLDVAFFFQWWDIDHAIQILDSCYLSAHSGLSNLIEKSLITISKYDNKLKMNDLLQEMGWEIVRQESMIEGGKRSRLKNCEDVYDILKNNKGTDSIKGISLEISKIRDIQLTSRVFANMSNLRFLKFYTSSFGSFDKIPGIPKVHLPQGLQYFPNKLRYIHWEGYPLKTFPLEFSFENLVVLELPYSNLEQLGEGIKQAFKLRRIDLSHSQYLTGIPNLLNATGLDFLCLEYCKSITRFPQISKNIKVLEIRGTAIEEIPTSICEFKSLHWLDLSDSFKLQILPEFLEKMKNLERLSLAGTTIRELPSSFGNLSGLRWLDLRNCRNLENICRICNLTTLYYIYLTGCIKLDKLPRNLGNLVHLEFLHAEEIAITQVPSSIAALRSLRELHLRDCYMLQSLGELPLQLEYLDLKNCKRLHSFAEPPSLRELDASQLKMESESLGPLFSRDYAFLFTNCLNMNENAYKNILAYARLRIHRLAVASLRLSNKMVFKVHFRKIRFALPGGEIPKWFSYQSSGAAITIGLPQHWFKRRLIGFALCIVVEFEGYDYKDLFLDINCCCYLKSNHEGLNHLAFRCTIPVANDWNGLFFGSEHVIVGYQPYNPCMDARLPRVDYTTASFRFATSFGGSFQVKDCGVCPVFAQYKLTQPNKFTVQFGAFNKDSGDTMTQEYTKIRKRHNFSTETNKSYEEVEPHPKRISREQISVPCINNRVPFINNRVPSLHPILCAIFCCFGASHL